MLHAATEGDRQRCFTVSVPRCKVCLCRSTSDFGTLQAVLGPLMILPRCMLPAYLSAALVDDVLHLLRLLDGRLVQHLSQASISLN